MSLYIQICIVEGNIELNALFSSLIGIQPFKVNGTWMSSFIINCMVMLISSYGMLAYLSKEFQSYLRGTACETLFGSIISNAKYIKYLYYYKVHSYAFVVFFLLVTGFLLSRASKKSKVKLF